MTSELTITPKTFEIIEGKMQDAGFSPEIVKREISFAVQAINKSSQLQKCSKESLLQSVLNISNIGLTLNPASKEAYLIPRWNGLLKQMDAVLEPSYVGLVKLLTDTGSVKSMVCNLVHQSDVFEIDLANNTNPVIHKPCLDKERGGVKAVYALATLTDGTRQVEYMNIKEVHEIRERSETYKAYLEKKIKSCTWITDEGEMTRKTVIKRIYKYLPRTEKMSKVDKAIEYDNSEFAASDRQIAYIDNLLHNCTLDERQISAIEMEISVMNGKRANEVIDYLIQNQRIDELKQIQRNARNIIKESTV